MIKTEIETIKEKLSDREWRINNLYFIKDAQGNKVKFHLNWAQNDFYHNMWYFNVILKARQLGFTTFAMIYFLDSCLFNDNHSAGVIAHTQDSAIDLFKNKIKFAYDNLPEAIKLARSATQDTARRLEFNNGSSITVGTSLRSGTFQKILISEYGKIAARYPDKAKEIKTGALNTVHVGQQVIVESTAEGQQGEFFDLCERARKLKDEGAELTRLDPMLHFYPWYNNPNYILTEREAANTSVDSRMAEYFKSLPDLKPIQKAWYIKKAEQQGEEVKREYPSTPAESFEQSMEGAYFTRQITTIRKAGQITRVPHEPSKPVYTFWDLGLNDSMSIWFFQHIGNEYRFIRYYENYGEGLAFYANYLRQLGYYYDSHIWPHDGNIRDLSTGKSRTDTAKSLGINPIRVIPRTKSVNDDIQEMRNVLPRCWFDKENCAQGLKHLENYRKEWDDKLGVWKDKPLHNEASHGADAFRAFAVGYTERNKQFNPIENQGNFVDNTYNVLDY